MLVEFVPELANSEEYLCSKFDEGLTLDTKEKMSAQVVKVTRKWCSLP